MKKLFSIVIILFVALLLFYRPLFSGQPLGLDALGHLSKVSYLQRYPFASWDMSWYSGTLFLKLYPPLFYYVVAIFPNIFFTANLFCFLSILFSSLGIYFLVKYLTQNEQISLFCGLGFLSVLSISYYWIATANLPYFAALWAIPFSLYFLEKSIKENKKKDFIFFSLIFSVGILTHVIIGFLIGVLMVVRFLFGGLNLRNFKRIFLYGAIPVLIVSFWFIPFLVYSTPSVYRGYIPDPVRLFGFKPEFSWGLQVAGIGVLIYLFIFSFFLFKKFRRNKLIRFYLGSLAILGFLLFGGLGSHYPFGVDPVRFILPFSIILSVCLGLIIKEAELFRNKSLAVLFFLVLIAGLVWNMTVINQNFDKHSYYKEGSRFVIIQEVLEQAPIEDNFTNYRFGTNRYVFGETLNYFMPSVSQTLGYQDVGMLNISSHNKMIQSIWFSDDINSTYYYLDWFAIKFFAIESSENESKLKNNSKFRRVMSFSRDYSFTMYEYLDAKPIISLADNLDTGNAGEIKQFEWERKIPGEIRITYDKADSDDVVLFKEFYHSSWAAKELSSGKNIDIEKVGPGFMAVYPSSNSKGIVFYQKKSFFEYLAIALSLVGIIILLGINKKYL